jgi:O-antigen ligase
MFFAFATGLAVGAIFSKTATKTKVVAVLTLAACLGATIFFANRTLLVIIVIMLVGYTAVMLLSARTSAARKALLLSLLALGLVLLAMAFFFNWFGLADRIMSLKLFQRISGDEGGRLEQWLSFFKDNAFLRYSMGGDQIAKSADISYLHNLWLDIYNRAGIIPFAMWSAFTVWTAKRILYFGKVMKKAERYKEYKIFLCVIFATVLNALVEPILEANPYFFLEVLMILGAAEGELRNIEMSRKLYAK